MTSIFLIFIAFFLPFKSWGSDISAEKLKAELNFLKESSKKHYLYFHISKNPIAKSDNIKTVKTNKKNILKRGGKKKTAPSSLLENDQISLKQSGLLKNKKKFSQEEIEKKAAKMMGEMINNPSSFRTLPHSDFYQEKKNKVRSR